MDNPLIDEATKWIPPQHITDSDSALTTDFVRAVMNGTEPTIRMIKVHKATGNHIDIASIELSIGLNNISSAKMLAAELNSLIWKIENPEPWVKNFSTNLSNVLRSLFQKNRINSYIPKVVAEYKLVHV